MMTGSLIRKRCPTDQSHASMIASSAFGSPGDSVLMWQPYMTKTISMPPKKSQLKNQPFATHSRLRRASSFAGFPTASR